MKRVWLSVATATAAAALHVAAENVTSAPAAEVESLKKQNADLQQRVEKLAGELEQIKTQLAGHAADAPSASAKKPANSGLDFEFYGFVKLDAAYDGFRISVGDYARWVESEQVNRNDDEFNTTANETRIGLSLLNATGNNFAGLWYPMTVSVICAVVCHFCIRETKDVDISKESTATAMRFQFTA